jgi:hypothetical protein
MKPPVENIIPEGSARVGFPFGVSHFNEQNTFVNYFCRRIVGKLAFYNLRAGLELVKFYA